jgi:glutamate-5-semialdehyde dehydrogenase
MATLTETDVDNAGLRELIAGEAERARAALAGLTDGAAQAAIEEAAAGLRAARAAVLAANESDVAAATGRLDAGAIDRLALSPARLDEIERQLLALAELPPLEREIDSWQLDNGLSVSVRRIPVGVVGANFEARPAVAVDLTSQLLKSLNACVLRTGRAALGTVTVLVDGVLRPALERAGLDPAAVGLVRSEHRDGARMLVSLPDQIPLVILRGSGESTAELGRLAADRGVRVLSHAEGGGVLYVDEAADLDRAATLIEASLDRLGVCNRLNLLLVHARLAPSLDLLLAAVRGANVEPLGTERACQVSPSLAALDVPLRHEWANDPERVATVTVDVVDSSAEAIELANRQSSGLAAAIVTEDAAAATAFFDGYRGTAVYWHAPTRFTDGFALTGAPETGINVDWAPGPRGPVTYRDLWLRQFRVVGDATQRR